MKFKYLNGLNTLRFFAAFFVIISHANISLGKLGVYEISTLAFLNRGGDAVNFFFTLSGFLITYLLLVEIDTTKTVSIRHFYLRRVFRIWPLYFLIVLVGFALLGFVYPRMYHKPYFEFPVWKGLLMFIFFVPNYAAKNFPVGLLNPLWSIGVEEQFYAFWAPLLKWCKHYLKPVIFLFMGLATVFYILVALDVFHFATNWQNFFLSQRFYAMGIGGVFAWLLFTRYEWYNRSIFANKGVQALIWAVVLWHYLVGFSFSEGLPFQIGCSFLYAMLILNVSVITNKLVNIERPWLAYLGKISYGLYMFHMVVDYMLRLVAAKFVGRIPKLLLIPGYYMVLVGITIVIAGLSFKYFEAYFLKLKNLRHPVSAA